MTCTNQTQEAVLTIKLLITSKVLALTLAQWLKAQTNVLYTKEQQEAAVQITTSIKIGLVCNYAVSSGETQCVVLV